LVRIVYEEEGEKGEERASYFQDRVPRNLWTLASATFFLSDSELEFTFTISLFLVIAFSDLLSIVLCELLKV